MAYISPRKTKREIFGLSLNHLRKVLSPSSTLENIVPIWNSLRRLNKSKSEKARSWLPRVYCSYSQSNQLRVSTILSAVWIFALSWVKKTTNNWRPLRLFFRFFFFFVFYAKDHFRFKWPSSLPSFLTTWPWAFFFFFTGRSVLFFHPFDPFVNTLKSASLFTSHIIL